MDNPSPTCSHCGAALNDSAAYCPHCGTPRPDDTDNDSSSDYNPVYEEILELANSLVRENQQFTRADLADFLKAYNYSEDSAEITQVVYNAFRHYKYNPNIRKAFLDNDRHRLLTETYHIPAASYVDRESCFKMLQLRLRDSNNSLSLADQQYDQLTDISSPHKVGLQNYLTGTAAIEQVRTAATTLYGNYEQLVENYREAKYDLKTLIADFVYMREWVQLEFTRQVTALQLLFGDSIRAVDPELFDFDSIAYLDTEQMLQQIQLAYDTLVSQCGVLINEINANFGNSLTQAAQSISKAKNLKAGIVIGAARLITHHLQAAERANQLKQQFLLLQNQVKHDAATIQGDLGRLTVIYKWIHDIYIPRTESYFDRADELFGHEWKEFFQALFSTPELQELGEERSEMLEELDELELNIIDNRQTIQTYRDNVERNQTLLAALRPTYQKALADKPQRPLVLLNWLSFGSLMRSYHRKVTEWDNVARPVIDQYQSLLCDVKLDIEAQRQQEIALKHHQARHEECADELKELHQQIRRELLVSPEAKRRILPHLESMVNLLRLGREIIESKLDPSLLQTVSIPEVDIRLTEAEQERIREFVAELSESLVPDKLKEKSTSEKQQEAKECQSDSEEPVDEQSKQPEEEEQDELQKQEEEEKAQMYQSLQEAVGQAVQTLESYLSLVQMRLKGQVAEQLYADHLMLLRRRFQTMFRTIDNRQALLQQTLAHIHTADTPEQVTAALLELMSSEACRLTETDLNQFLRGEKTIEI